MLETFGRRDYGDSDPDADHVPAGGRRDGTVAYGGVFRKGEGRRRGVLPAVEFGEWAFVGVFLERIMLNVL